MRVRPCGSLSGVGEHYVLGNLRGGRRRENFPERPVDKRDQKNRNGLQVPLSYGRAPPCSFRSKKWALWGKTSRAKSRERGGPYHLGGFVAVEGGIHLSRSPYKKGTFWGVINGQTVDQTLGNGSESNVGTLGSLITPFQSS